MSKKKISPINFTIKKKDDEKENFDNACILAKTLQNVSNENKLLLYSFYKQVLFGNNENTKPSIFNRIEMEKWKAWHKNYGMEKESAMIEYTNLVKKLDAFIYD
jgi:acyl-CoA-binding protein